MKFPPFSPRLHGRALESRDYVRYASLLLAAQRIVSEGVRGSIAEVGVWRGDTGELLAEALPDRTCFLLDTFEGFHQDDLESAQLDERFRDTSLATVHARFASVANVVIVPGRVPFTLEQIEDEQFALVTLDLDVFEPTRTSLEFFYPRLSPGGYCFVHDYNSPESNEACRRAVGEFSTNKPEPLIDVADVWGSVLFRKA